MFHLPIYLEVLGREGVTEMRTIKISDEVWSAIAERGKFGETEDDVLRKVFSLSPATRPVSSGRRGRGRTRHATKKMSARVQGGHLVVEFEDGARDQWPLPERTDKDAIRAVRDTAVSFALDQGASDPGQTNAVRKALTDSGYHLIK